MLDVNETSQFGPVNITLGPLSYKYRVSQLKLHFGGKNGYGSEHSVNGEFFDGEMHVLAYNADIYSNFSQAKKSPRGVAVIGAFLQVGSYSDEDFEKITSLSQLVLYKGQRARLKQISLLSLLPDIKNYITYEGSFTQPGCYETVTWIILNRPIVLNHKQLEALRNLRQRYANHPRVFMADNRRPIMPLNRRTLRTNINFKKDCTMEQDMHYQLNTKFKVKK